MINSNDIPITTYNYSYIRDQIYKDHQLNVSVPTIIMRAKEYHFYLTFLCEKPVATSMLFTSAGIARLYLISTLPEHRNRGIGKTITLATLLTAEQMGCKIGGLFATQLGEMVYRRLGFKEFCNFDIYYY